ncbi:MAG TPA: helix-turn-helix domain-containing protein [Mycobacteriales bacterium]|nr:helix-turn-helix domain-containing protein [Mycobacteriales bacterium]
MSDVAQDVSIEEAAVELGMSPTAVIRLLDTGQLPSHVGTDGRRSRIDRAHLELHRDQRFALRQQMAQEQRALRWAEASGVPMTTRDTGADDMPV